MDNILNKSQVIYINEKAVDWDQSAAGLLSKAASKPMSWLFGSLKQGYQKQVIQGLVDQWGLQYVEALKNMDTKSDTTDSEQSNDSESTTTLDPQEKQKFIDNIKYNQSIIENLKNSVKVLNSWNVMYPEKHNDQFSKLIKLIKPLYVNKKFDLFLENSKIENIETYSNNVNIIQNFTNNLLSSSDYRNFILKNQDASKLKPIYQKIINNINQLQDIYEIVLSDLQGTQLGESLLIEAVSTKLLDQASLDKLKAIPDIKKKSFNYVNLIKLNSLMYQAKYTIEKAKIKGTKDKYLLELQKTWDLGITNINDYYQDVIDVVQVMKKVTGQVDADLKKDIESQIDHISELEQMGITEIFPVGKTFDPKKVYAIDIDLTTQHNTKLSTILLVSPLTEMSEHINNQTYNWFKLFGQFTYDKKTKQTVRVNLFEKASTSKKMINNFDKDTNSYYVALDNLTPNAKISHMFVYSNTGKLFYNYDIYQDTDQIKTELVKQKQPKFEDTLKKLYKFANVFKYKLNQTFVVSEESIKQDKYQGIDQKTIISETGYDLAKSNHDKFIKSIS